MAFINNKSKFCHDRPLFYKGKVWVFCPSSPGAIKVEWLDINGKSRENILKIPRWTKYNNTFWWYSNILLHQNCISICVHTFSFANSHMNTIINPKDNRFWSGLFDSALPDYWQSIDLTKDSPDWTQYKNWETLDLDITYHCCVGTPYVFVSFNIVPIGIARL